MMSGHLLMCMDLALDGIHDIGHAVEKMCVNRPTQAQRLHISVFSQYRGPLAAFIGCVGGRQGPWGSDPADAINVVTIPYPNG